MNRDDFLDKFQKFPVNVYQHRTHAESLVSVCVQTYQHINFIKDCLDGLLMQKTVFPFEILLGEDASTDGTRKVCINYAEKYPDKIRLFLHHRGNNIKINGMPTGRFNFMYNLFTARGKYIALCEGDDYWTDPFKLQKQVDFLESHPKCVICYHNAWIRHEDRSQEDVLFVQPFQPKFSCLQEVLHKNFIPTASVMFRNHLFDEFPPWFQSVSSGDWPLHILNAEHGLMGYLEDTMSVYRIHKDGINSSLWASNDFFSIYLNKIKMYKLIDKHFGFRYNKIIRFNISRLYYDLSCKYLAAGDRIAARHCFFKSLYAKPFSNYIPIKRWIVMFLRLNIPFFETLYAILRN